MTSLHNPPAGVSRRSFLRYVGFGAATAAVGPALGPLARPVAATMVDGAWCAADGSPLWAPVAYPLPLPDDADRNDAARLAAYDVVDDVVLPAGFRYEVVATWGDRFGPPGRQIVFGHNADYTGLVPVPGAEDEYFMVVNHEYISARPWLQAAGELFGVDGAALLADPPRLCDLAMRDLGLTVLHVRRRDDGVFAPIVESERHFRVHGLGAEHAAPDALRFSGPPAAMLGACTGTHSNCSGATTPWGTFLSCEENFQDYVQEFIRPDGAPLAIDYAFGLSDVEAPTNLPFEFEGLGVPLSPPMDGRRFGWVGEVDPVRRTFVKHGWLGRFRHENVALRVERGRRLAAYMGDDRRGGHLWKFVSEGVVNDPRDPENARLFERGTLYVARLDESFTGRWIPLAPQTPVRRPEPEHCASGHLWLPQRPAGGHVAVAVDAYAKAHVSAEQWMRAAAEFAGKPAERLTLGDLVDPSAADRQAVLLIDAYAMANAAGGTPTSRPEDIEIHPFDRSIYIAFTDSTGSGDGSPDVRIFPDSRGENSRQYGAIYRMVEEGDDPAAERFTWGKFVSSGEAAEGGGGFACADNLVFDAAGNLWMVTDITTPAHNFPVERKDKTAPGQSRFPGLFGNNAMFMIPTAGPLAGVPRCFAIGPTECEMTGPTFSDDGRTLVLAVQHPGEFCGTRGMPGVQQPDHEIRRMVIAARDGSTFEQRRRVPLGSNWPSRSLGTTPKSAVICITRQA